MIFYMVYDILDPYLAQPISKMAEAKSYMTLVIRYTYDIYMSLGHLDEFMSPQNLAFIHVCSD